MWNKTDVWSEAGSIRFKISVEKVGKPVDNDVDGVRMSDNACDGQYRLERESLLP